MGGAQRSKTTTNTTGNNVTGPPPLPLKNTVPDQYQSVAQRLFDESRELALEARRHMQKGEIQWAINKYRTAAKRNFDAADYFEKEGLDATESRKAGALSLECAGDLGHGKALLEMQKTREYMTFIRNVMLLEIITTYENAESDYQNAVDQYAALKLRGIMMDEKMLRLRRKIALCQLNRAAHHYTVGNINEKEKLVKIVEDSILGLWGEKILNGCRAAEKLGKVVEFEEKLWSTIGL